MLNLWLTPLSIYIPPVICEKAALSLVYGWNNSHHTMASIGDTQKVVGVI